MKNRISITLLILALSLTGWSQSWDGLNELSDEDQEEFRFSTRQKLKELGDHISIIADKSQPYEVKKKHKEETYKLFHELGYGHFVEISFRGDKRKVPNRSYFNNLSRLKYARVDVKFTDILYLSNLYKLDNGTYTATATILQKFTGYGEEGKPVYASIDKKNIEVIVERKEDWWGEERWVAVLGDITVEQTDETK